MARECPSLRNVCYKCGEYGHKSKDYPKTLVKSLIYVVKEVTKQLIVIKQII